jgi:predicted nucleic acid-binding protein
MRTVFADACFWIALYSPHDQLHEKARDAISVVSKCRLVTSEMVLTEFLNGLADKGVAIRENAVKAVRAIMGNPNVDVVPQTSQQFRSATDYYDRFRDKEWGLVDCASMQIMNEKSINEALTHDRHFQQAGFAALMRD